MEQTNANQLPENIKVHSQKATKLLAPEIIVVSGILEAHKTAPISFLVPGKVVHVYVDEGEHVEEDQILAEVENNDYRSNLEIAKAQLFEAQDSYNRMQPLYRDGVIAESTFIKIESRYNQTKASRDIAKKKLQDTKLLSPISGIIGTKNIEKGETIQLGKPVFTVVKTDKIYAKVAVPESEIGSIRLGQNAAVSIKSLNNRIVFGLVTLIGAVAEPLTRTYTVKIELLNPDLTLLTGMIAMADITTDKTIDIITIPGKAIVRDADNLTYVFLVDSKKEMALRQRVTPGAFYGNEIEIKKGLSDGDLVVVAGQNKLTDGSQIRVVDSTQDFDTTISAKQK